MPDDTRQLVLELGHEARYGAEDFLVSPSNEQAYMFIERWPDWSDRVLLLIGPQGSGKSHLAAIWAERARAQIVDVSELSAETVPLLSVQDAIVIENAEGTATNEAEFFHLLNLVRERQSHALITATGMPGGWGIRTPDLLSRLRLAPSVTLEEPDDALLRAVLVKLFIDRQLIVDTRVIDYVMARMERSLARAREIVAMLDEEALRRGRRITRAMAAEIFRETIDEEDEHL